MKAKVAFPAVVSLTLVACVLTVPCVAGDWPQFRCDAGRSAASAEQLPAELHLQWVREYPAPRPAFPTELRLRYDASYEPVVLGKTMFVPSMVTDSVAALDTDTGKVRWRFFTGGPVRFAPVAWQDKVYVASDDGYLYCLDAASGALQWQFRGLPQDRNDRKVLGNQRLISLYPARGGPVLAGGIVYFAAGVWPSAGIFVHALDATTGKAVWSNVDSHHIEKANLDHGVRSPAGLTPQGYLVALGEKLVVPCGAQLPGFLDRKTGKREDYTTGWGGRVGLPKGGWFVAGTSRYLIHGGDLFDLQRPNDERLRNSKGSSDFKGLLYPGGYTRLQIDPTCQKALGEFRQPVLTPEAMYCNTLDGNIAAFDLTKPKLEQRTASNTPGHRRNDQYPDKWQATFPELWRIGCKLKVQIKAGSRLYAAAPGSVAAIDLPQQGGEAKISWRAEIEGTPQRLLAADGKLFVVTLEGRIYAFGPNSDVAVAVHPSPQPAAPTADDAWRAAATRLLADTKASEGYAIVFGIGSGRLAEEIVRQSSLYVIAVDPDREKIAALRQKLYEAGIYGTRIAMHAGDPLAYPFPPYMASLVVSEELPRAADSAGEKFAERAFHLLRPYGGTACLPARLASVARRLAERSLPQADLRESGDLFLVTRRGPLPGAANWSHQGATAANTAACEDRAVKAPLDLLWFDGAVRWFRTPGRAVVRVAGGRVFIRATSLRAIDVYTGRHMWEVAMAASGGSPAPGDVAALDDVLYAATRKGCLVLDAATGSKLREIALPADGAAASWSNLRVSADYLVASAGRQVVCADRHSGSIRWTYPAAGNRLRLALGGGKVFCAELPRPPARRGEKPANDDSRTFALDLQNGKLLWEIPKGSEPHYSQAHDLLITAAGMYRGKDGQRVGDSQAAWCIAGDRLICGKADSIEIRNLPAADSSGDPVKWFRRGCTGLRASRHLVTTRSGGNAAYIDLETLQITPVWNIRAACNNNLFPANGVLNVPNLTGGCTCNYTPTSMALVPSSVIENSSGASGAASSD